MNERITVELSRNEWIALIAAAIYGPEVESRIGGYTAGVADNAVALVQSRLNIDSIEYEARKIERLTNMLDQV